MSFASGLINSLSNPSYTQGLFNLGQQVGSMPARREAAQFDTQATQTQYQGGAAAEQGDVGALSMRKQQLIDMLGNAPTEEARQNLKNAIQELNNMTASTKDLAKKNKIDSVIEMERAIEDDSTPPEAKQAFIERIKTLQGDPEIERGVATQKRNIEYATLTANSEMYEARLKSEVQALNAAGFGTDAWNDLATKVSREAVDTSREQALQTEANNAEFAEIIKDKTWDENKTAVLRSKGIAITGDLSADLAVYRSIMAAEAKATQEKIASTSGAINEAKAKSLVAFTLSEIAKRGDVPFDAPWADDIEEVINEDMSEEEKAALVGLVQGMSADDAVSAIENYLKTQYPDAWKKSEKRLMDNIQSVKDDFIVTEILKANNLSDTPENRLIATEAAERARAGK